MQTPHIHHQSVQYDISTLTRQNLSDVAPCFTGIAGIFLKNLQCLAIYLECRCLLYEKLNQPKGLLFSDTNIVYHTLKISNKELADIDSFSNKLLLIRDATISDLYPCPILPQIPKLFNDLQKSTQTIDNLLKSIPTTIQAKHNKIHQDLSMEILRLKRQKDAIFQYISTYIPHFPQFESLV